MGDITITAESDTLRTRLRERDLLLGKLSKMGIDLSVMRRNVDEMAVDPQETRKHGFIADKLLEMEALRAAIVSIAGELKVDTVQQMRDRGLDEF